MELEQKSVAQECDSRGPTGPLPFATYNLLPVLFFLFSAQTKESCALFEQGVEGRVELTALS